MRPATIENATSLSGAEEYRPDGLAVAPSAVGGGAGSSPGYRGSSVWLIPRWGAEGATCASFACAGVQAAIVRTLGLGSKYDRKKRPSQLARR